LAALLLTNRVCGRRSADQFSVGNTGVKVTAPAHSQFLSLAATLEFAKGQIKARSTLEGRVWRPLYRALFEGTLSAIGDFEDREGTIVFKDREVLSDDWRALRESDFHQACYRTRVLELPDTKRVRGGPFFLTNVRIRASQVRSWLGFDAIPGSPAATKQFSPRDLERDVKDQITQARLAGSKPKQEEVKRAFSKKYPRGEIRNEFKRQIEAAGGEVKAGRPAKAPPENSRP
jgi:hypothetical protein